MIDCTIIICAILKFAEKRVYLLFCDSVFCTVFLGSQNEQKIVWLDFIYSFDTIYIFIDNITYKQCIIYKGSQGVSYK